MRSRYGWWIAIAAGLAFRVALVLSWNRPTGDQLQYYALAQELLTHHRFAFQPEPFPLAWTRLPGYPLFVAFLAAPFPMSLESHIVRVTLWNALLDLGSALIAARILVEMGRAAAARYGFTAVVVCPLMMFLSTCGLTESLATLLAAVEVLLILRISRGVRITRNAALLGIAAGCAQLVRADALFLLPAAVLALGVASAPRRAKLLSALVFSGAFAVVFAPWPVRNQLEFGSPHPLGTAWIRMDGAAQRQGMLDWMRTWSTSQPGDGFLMVPLAYDHPLDVNRPGIVLPAMYDDDAERSRVVGLFEEYDRTRITPGLDQEFAALAAERAHRAPLRTWLLLPLLRGLAAWRPLPEYEVSVRASWLGLPSMRGAYGRFERLLLALAVVGAAVLWRASERRAVAILLCAIATRTALPAALQPFPIERYVVEVFPAILAMTGVGAAFLVESFKPARGDAAAKGPRHPESAG